MTATQTTDQAWFLSTRVSFPLGHDRGGDGISVIESEAPYGDSPPLHVHRAQDEVFHVLAGTLRLRVGDGELTAGPGETLLAPRGVPHTYRVESAQGARWLVITRGGDFEDFVRSLARPPEDDGLPTLHTPTADEQALLAEAAAAHGIDLVGPPLR